MTNANIFWGLVAGAGVIVAAIGTLWAWLGGFPIGALWAIGGGAGMTALAANLIIE